MCSVQAHQAKPKPKPSEYPAQLIRCDLGLFMNALDSTRSQVSETCLALCVGLKTADSGEDEDEVGTFLSGVINVLQR